MKKLAFLFTLVLCFATTPATAKAQTGVYGQLDLTGDTFTNSGYFGLDGGLYATLFKSGPVHLGLDARGAYANPSYIYRSFVVGPRLQFKPPNFSISPYIQGAVGVGRFNSTAVSPHVIHFGNQIQYGFIAGLDRTWFSHLDVRVIDVEYLRMSGTNVVSAATGIVIRLP